MSKKKIISAVRGRTNRHEWTLTLGCGHKVPLTSNRRPDMTSIHCIECARPKPK